MKKNLLWVFICLSFTVSCSDDKVNDEIVPPTPGPDTTIVKIDVAKYIEGEWITETHGGSEGKQMHSWETIKFESTTLATINGLYEEYADGKLAGSKTQDNNTLLCKITDDIITLKGNNTERTLTISDINEVAFKATEGGATVQYSHILGSTVEVLEGAETPDYKTLLPEGATIKGFKSSNERIVNVNSSGELSPVASGSTIVYVETDKGTAAIRVVVKRLFETDYAALFGRSKADVEAVLGKVYTEEDGKLTYNTNAEATFENYYQRNAGNWSKIEVVFDNEGKVNDLTLTARDDVWFTTEQMTTALAGKNNAYDKASSQTEKVFLNAASLKEATMRIIWNTEQRTLTYAPNSTDIIIGKEMYMPDYEGLLGITGIKSYRTENEYIVTVDAETGMLTGIDSGNTNIVVETEKGTVVLPVQVHIFLAKDYESLLGKSEQEIIAMYGTVPTTDWDNPDYQIFKYGPLGSFGFPQTQRASGNWINIKFKYDKWNRVPISEIILTARDDVWFTDSQMIAFLNENFIYDESQSTEDNLFFVNNREEDLVTASYVWNTNDHKLTIAKFTYF